MSGAGLPFEHRILGKLRSLGGPVSHDGGDNETSGSERRTPTESDETTYLNLLQDDHADEPAKRAANKAAQTDRYQTNASHSGLPLAAQP